MPTFSGGERSLRVLPWLVAMAFFMSMLDASILNTALPAIADSLDASPLRMHSVVVAYMLTVATLIPASGWLADRFGIRPVFLLAISLFTLGSFACAISPSLETLVVSRVLQGTGGALMGPVGRLSILRAYPRADLVRILSFITIPGLMGPLMGPALGGTLVQYASWHWIFLINIPVGLLGMLLTIRYMPELPAVAKHGSFDWLGFLLFGTAMITITLALESLGETPLSREYRYILAGIGVSCLAAYAIHAAKAASPVFSPKLFQTRNFTVGILGNLFSRLGMGAMPFLTPLLLQVGLGYSPLKAGLTLLPITLGAMIAKSFVNKLIKAMGFRWFLFCNTMLVAAALASYSLITAGTPEYCILAFFTIAGIINSLQFTGMSTLTLLDLPDEQAGSGNSLFSCVMQLSMGMGVALASAVLDVFADRDQDIVHAFSSTFLVLAAITAVSTVIYFFARHTEGLRANTSK